MAIGGGCWRWSNLRVQWGWSSWRLGSIPMVLALASYRWSSPLLHRVCNADSIRLFNPADSFAHRGPRLSWWSHLRGLDGHLELVESAVLIQPLLHIALIVCIPLPLPV